jgi:outer membrane protein assembly factor BamD (BamD/ComL family)
MIARALAVALAVAPMQCAHEPDPSLRWNDTPGDALWQLAQEFRDSHDDAAARRTLEYLVERYPSSRWAQAARDELAKAQPAFRRRRLATEGDAANHRSRDRPGVR